MFPSRQTARPPFTKSGLYCGIAATCFVLLILAFKHAGGRELHAAVFRGRQGVQTSSSYPWIPPLRTRDQLADILQGEGKQVGAELGVQRGLFSAQLLTSWKSCRTMYLVDIWRAQTNYKDVANVDNANQEAILAEAKQKHSVHVGKSVFIRNLTTEAVGLITEPLDFVYVDARHDYCGAKADIAAYWPKLKSGGIMAGHDYLTSSEVKAMDPAQDWSVCMDGSIQETAVKGAVNDFFRAKGISVLVTYAEQWPTWFVRKP